MKTTKQTLIALDQLVNALVGGWADETISARAHRNAARGNARWRAAERVIDAVFFWQRNHCAESFRMEQGRWHLPPAYRPVAGEPR